MHSLLSSKSLTFLFYGAHFILVYYFDIYFCGQWRISLSHNLLDSNKMQMLVLLNDFFASLLLLSINNGKANNRRTIRPNLSKYRNYHVVNLIRRAN